MTTPTSKTSSNSARRRAIASPLPEQLLSVEQIARLDNCSERTVRRAIRSGLLEALRIGPKGRLLRISKAAHAAYRHALKG